MDHGIKLQKELAMGLKSAQRETTSTAPAAGKKLINKKCGGLVSGKEGKK